MRTLTTETMSDKPDLLFIYGTLKAVAEHPHGALLRRCGDLVGLGSIRARLYLIDEIDDQGPNSFPGALPSAHEDDRVHGELWHLHDPDAVFPTLDAYENCGPEWPQPNEFLLRPVDVTLENGTVERAVTYFYTWDVSRARHIPSGRFDMAAPLTR